LSIVISCTTVPPAYRSTVLDERGEVAILSVIKLEGEVNLGNQELGIFSSIEKSQFANKKLVLFVLKYLDYEIVKTNNKGIDAYNFTKFGSITMEQAKNLILALDDYLNKKPSEFQKNELYNFELTTGLIDSERQRIKEVTFIINYSISNSGKVFRTIFAGAKGYHYYELKEEDVRKMRNIINDIVLKYSNDNNL